MFSNQSVMGSVAREDKPISEPSDKPVDAFHFPSDGKRRVPQFWWARAPQITSAAEPSLSINRDQELDRPQRRPHLIRQYRGFRHGRVETNDGVVAGEKTYIRTVSNWRRAMRPMPPSRSSWPLALLEGFHSRCCDACSKRYLGQGPLADQIACHKRKVTPGVIPFGGTLSRPLPPRFAWTLRWRKTDSNSRPTTKGKL